MEKLEWKRHLKANLVCLADKRVIHHAQFFQEKADGHYQDQRRNRIETIKKKRHAGLPFSCKSI